jgi:translation initiation factor IF-2
VVQPPQLIEIEDTITVRELAEKLTRSPANILKKLMELGIMASINQIIDFETAEIVCSLYETKVRRVLSAEQKLLEEIIDDEESLQNRPPVVTVMGHVDHGKTSLLDRIRQANVVSGEAGGITQHIGAYQVNIHDNRITFIDTPGHEAFTAMRARGANLTDIVVLVVAADDGVMPQTIEAINHIRAAKVPFLVAVNKIDKPEANPERVMRQLTEHGILAEEWGGDIIFVPVSAKSGEGIETLLEMILLLAEMNDIKANPDRPAEGVVIEGELDKGRGAISTVLVQKGTLKIGDYLLADVSWCKVRAMTDYRGRRVDKALPSMPVEITGWSGVPEAGSKVQACDEKTAKAVTTMRANEKKIEEQKQNSRISLDDFFRQMKEADAKDLNLIIKGDVQGSIEALVQSLVRLSTDEVKVNVIHSAVGAVTETDVMLASASNAIIIGFNVRPDSKARKYAEDENIDVRLYRVIYEAIDDVKKAMVGLLDPEYKEKYLGRAEVRQVFRVPNIGAVGGCYVLDGKIQRNANVRILRDGVIVFEGKLASLRRFKDDVKEVVENYECGMGINNFNDIKEGDVIEAFTMEEVPRHL